MRELRAEGGQLLDAVSKVKVEVVAAVGRHGTLQQVRVDGVQVLATLQEGRVEIARLADEGGSEEAFVGGNLSFTR